MIKRMVVFGATSAIAESVLRLYATRNVAMLLIARNAEKLAPIIADLSTRGASKVDSIITDLDNLSQHPDLFHQIHTLMPNADLLLIAQGVLLPQSQLDDDPVAGLINFHTNANSVISLMMHGANFLAQTASPSTPKHLAVIGSVAGDAGRAKMTLYGAAKAAIDRVAGGLSGRFFERPIHITLIKPGYIATPMTLDVPHSPLMSSTSQTAPLIVKAIDEGWRIVYVPRWWWLIMFIIKHLPRSFLYRAKI